MTKATFEHPAFPKGEEFGLDNLPGVLVKNGEPFDLPEGVDPTLFDNDPHMTIAGHKKPEPPKAEEAEEGGEEA